jgi:abhydrolase domain-containing protein 6
MPAKRRRLRALALLLGLGSVGLVALAGFWPQLALDAEFARLRWLAGAREVQVDVDDGRIVQLEAGSGPALVLLHGFTGTKENWLALMPLLATHHRVVAPDLPGWGESTRTEAADYGYAAQAERLAAWLATLGDAPVILVGHSMGGGIAAVIAARHPERVSRLVLMDAGGALFRENAFGLAVLRGENPFGVHDRASLDRYLGTVFESPPYVPWPADAALIARRVKDAEFENTVLDRIGRGPDAFLPAAEATRVRQPTLLLWCRNDRVIDASAADVYRAAIPQSKTVLLDGCNHMPMIETPETTALALEEFLR